MEASEKGASGSQISPGSSSFQYWAPSNRNLFIKYQTMIMIFPFFSSGHLFLRDLFHLLLCPTHGQQVMLFLYPLAPGHREPLVFSIVLRIPSWHATKSFQVWAAYHLHCWNPHGSHVGRPLWHPHVRVSLEPFPCPGLHDPLLGGLQHGSALVHGACNSTCQPSHTSCCCLCSP